MSTITPHLWFDTQAKEAAEFYAAVFPDSSVTSVTTLRDTPSGDSDVVAFRVWGQDFMAISAGPLFSINPAISFIVNFDPSRDGDAASLIDQVWAQLAADGTVLMPLDEFYGFVQASRRFALPNFAESPLAQPFKQLIARQNLLARVMLT